MEPQIEDAVVVSKLHQQEIALLVVGGGVVVMAIIVMLLWSRGFFENRQGERGQWTPERKRQALEELNEEAKKQGIQELSQEEKMLILNNGNR